MSRLRRISSLAALTLWACAPATESSPSPDVPALAPNPVVGGAAGAAGDVPATDAGTAPVDAGFTAAAIDAGEPVGDAVVEDFELPAARPDLFDGPARLSEAGLYADLTAGVLADGVEEYTPIGELWSDGAEKRRWLALPEGAQIDTRDMDDWSFPVGTRAFKEFTRDGVRIETRMIWKRGPGDWPMVAYLWSPDQTEAYAAPEGRADVSGTPHDVPDATLCPDCHDGRSDTLLGPTAVMLSHAGPGLTLDDLIAARRLSDPPPGPLALPGDAATRRALAYLHANCGHCHNPTRVGADRHISVYLWQPADALASLEDTVTYRSLVTDKGSPLWIDAVLARMADRSSRDRMPPLATDEVDTEGMGVVGALMERLRQDVPTLPPPARGGTCPDAGEVFEIFEAAGCRSSFCHGTAGGGLYYGTAEELRDATVAAAPLGDDCQDVGISRVEPGAPERSLLWLKLRPGPPCGTVMPPVTGLTAEQIDTVAVWIADCTATP